MRLIDGIFCIIYSFYKRRGESDHASLVCLALAALSISALLIISDIISYLSDRPKLQINNLLCLVIVLIFSGTFWLRYRDKSLVDAIIYRYNTKSRPVRAGLGMVIVLYIIFALGFFVTTGGK